MQATVDKTKEISAKSVAATKALVSDIQSDLPKYTAEFIGTYVLVLTVGCNVLGGVSVWAVTSIAASLMVMIYALGAVSGAHFNPAVTLAISLSAKGWEGGFQKAALYALVQVLAGTCAALTYIVIFLHNFNLQPGAGYSIMEAGVAEFLYTFMLCFVVLNCACSQATAGNQFFGLAIGFVIVAGGYAVGAISGGAFNPAVALGVDLASINKGFGYSLIYVAIELAAAVAASGVFRLVRTEEFGGKVSSTELMPKLLSEFIGTYFLVVTVGFNVLTGSAAAAFSIAASLMCMIYALGNVSGAHFNPAVTFSIWLSGRNKIDTTTALQYVGAQLLGGLAAGVTYSFTLGKAFALGPVGAYSWFAAALGEIIFTAVLCFVVLSVATTAAPSKDMFGLAIGSCVTVGGFAVGGVSGGSLNPAVSFGIDAANALHGGTFMNCLTYSVFELVGAGLATAAFYGTQPAEYAKLPKK